MKKIKEMGETVQQFDWNGMWKKFRVNKLVVLSLVFVVFLLLLSFFIVPSQGGLISSTKQAAADLAKVDPSMKDTMPIQDVGLGAYGRSIFIAAVMLTHVLFANLHLGGSWVAVFTEAFYLKSKDMRYKRLARSITLFNVILFSTGATFAVGGVLFFIGLFPKFASTLFHLYWWPLLFEAVAFALEILFLYTYWFAWDKISNFWHQVLGYGYGIVVFIQVLLIDMVAGGMLTPGDNIKWGSSGMLTMDWGTLMSWWFNDTLWRLQFHRLAASISYFGFIIAMLAMFHYQDRKRKEEKREWDWVGSYGIAWGLLGLIFQPILGLLYMFKINDVQSNAFEMMMHGSRAWEMLFMVTLLSTLFITIIIYFIERRESILSLPEYRKIKIAFKVFLGVAVLCAFILVQPAWLGAKSINDASAWANPLGVMDLKYLAMFTLILIGSSMLTIDAMSLGSVKESEWGNLSDTARIACIMAGGLGMWIVIVMGFVRESARSPWLIYGKMPVPGGMAHPTPISIDKIFFVWVIIMAVTITIFWAVSKVTAHHPEKKEEV